jgi:hypothetical protein
MLRLPDFLWGVLTGVILTVALSRFWAIYRGWVRQANAIRRPLRIDEKTSKTPMQIYGEAARARTKIIILYIVIFVGIGWLIQSIWPEQIDALFAGLGDFFRNMF